MNETLPICEAGKVVWKTSFACDSDTLAIWDYETQTGSIGFAVDALPENPGAWDDGCSLNFNDNSGYSSGPNGSSAATATSPAIELGLSEGDDAELHVGFWEWIDIDNQDGTDIRRVGLVSDAGLVLAEKELPDDPAQNQVWVYREVVFTLGGADTTVRLRFSFDSVDEKDNEGKGWFIDRLVVSSQKLN